MEGCPGFCDQGVCAASGVVEAYAKGRPAEINRHPGASERGGAALRGPHGGGSKPKQHRAREFAWGASPGLSWAREFSGGASPGLSWAREFPGGASPGLSWAREFSGGASPGLSWAREFPGGASPGLSWAREFSGGASPGPGGARRAPRTHRASVLAAEAARGAIGWLIASLLVIPAGVPLPPACKAGR
jgi:hypothetical protein